jgi:hypothetical protein
MRNLISANQLSLFPEAPKPRELTFKEKWWQMHNYTPALGGMTFLPVVSTRLLTGNTLYTCMQLAYIHFIIRNKVVVLMPELWSGNWKCYSNEWLVLKYTDCDPVTRYGFKREEFEKLCPNIPFPEELKALLNNLPKPR